MGEPIENYRGVYKPPRRLPGDLQQFPAHPWMFTWPMSAHERLRLSNWAYYGSYPCMPTPVTSCPYKTNWQFRDHRCDNQTHPGFVDLRGGPASILNVTNYCPQKTPHPEFFLSSEEKNDTPHSNRNQLLATVKEECENQRAKRMEVKLWEEWMNMYAKKYYYV